MIEAENILSLLEEFERGIKFQKDYIEVYSNPSRDELKELGDVIRFVAHWPTKKVYVWDAYLAMHSDVMDKMGLTKPWDKIDYLKGTMKQQGSGYEVIILTFGDLGGEKLRQLCQQDWSWTSRYGVDLKTYLRVHKPGQSK
jgi:hypothetical protein